MKNKFFLTFFMLPFTFILTGAVGICAQTVSPVDSQISRIKISGAVLATLKNGDYVCPIFSPDRKRLAYSNVIVENLCDADIDKTGKMIAF